MFDGAAAATLNAAGGAAETAFDERLRPSDRGSSESAQAPAAVPAAAVPAVAVPLAAPLAAPALSIQAAIGDDSAGELAALLSSLEALPDEGSGAVAEATSGLQYVFVDARVARIIDLSQDVPADSRVIVLAPDRDGIEQMAAALSGAREVSAVHLLSHGQGGSVRAGSVDLDAASIAGVHATALRSIGTALAADADLLIYGCDFAAGEAGAQTLAALAAATGADVAASVDQTGAARLGGNWVLERAFGPVETTRIALASFDGLLAEPVAPPVLDLHGRAPTIHEIVAWQHDGNSLDAVWLQSFVGSAEPETAGPGLSLSFPSTTTMTVNGVDTASYADAVLAGDYLSYRFTTNGTVAPGMVLNQVYFGQNGFGTADFKVSIAISDNGFASSSWLVRDQQVVPPPSAGGLTLAVPAVALSANTEYEIRAYLYDRQGTTIEWDDFRPSYAINAPPAHLGQIENEGPLSLVGPEASIEQLGAATLASASVTLSGGEVGDALLVDGSAAASGVLASGIAWSRSASRIDFSGSASRADYLAALQWVQFQHSGEAPSTAVRSISFEVSDGFNSSAPAEVLVSVVAVNDSPIHTVPGPVTTAEGSAVAISGLSVADPDNAALTTTLTVSHGALSVASGSGATLSGNQTASVTLSGSASQINLALAGLSYLPTAHYSGSDALVITTSDGALNDSDSIALTVTPVPTPPRIGYDFDTNEVLYATNVSSFPTTALSYEATVALDGGYVGTVRTLFSYGVVDSANEFGVFYGTNATTGINELRIWVNDSLRVLVFTPGAEPRTLLVVWDSTAASEQLRAYADGQLLGTHSDAPGGALSTPLTAGGVITLGQDQDSMGGGFDVAQALAGDVYTTRLWSSALTPAQVAAQFRSQGGPPADVLDIDFTRLNNTTVYSRSGTSIASLGRGTVSFPSTIVPLAGTPEDQTTIGLGLDRTLVDRDGSETLQTTVSGIPVGAVLFDGTHSFTASAGNTSVDVSLWDLEHTRLQPEPNRDTNVTLTLTATARETATGATASTTSLVTLVITPVNDAPVNTLPASWATPQRTPLVLSGLAVHDIDAASQPISLSLVVSQGALTALSGAGVTVTGSGTASVTLTGSQANLNAFLAGSAAPVFTPPALFSGTVSLTMTSHDGGNSGAGGARTDVDVASIVVAPLQYQPTLVTRVVAGADVSRLVVWSHNGFAGDVTPEITVPGYVVSAGNEAIGPGVTQTFGSTTSQIRNIGASNFAEAWRDGEYVSYQFTLADTVPSGLYIDRLRLFEPGNFGLAVLVDTDPAFGSPTVLQAPRDTNGTTGTNYFFVNAPLLLEASTTYYLRAYVYGAETVAWDDFGFHARQYAIEYTATYVENGGAVNIAHPSQADVGDGGDADLVSLSIQASGLVDGAAEILTLGGRVFNAATSSTETVTIGTTPMQISFDADLQRFSIVHAGAGILRQADLDQLLRGISYRHSGDAPSTGPRSLAFQVSDQSGNSSVVVRSHINVTAVDDAPVIVVPAEQSVTEDEALALPGISVSDVDSVSLSTVLTVTQGRLSVDASGTAVVTGNGAASVTVSGTAAQINAALVGLVYQPGAHYSGADTLTVTTSDSSQSVVRTVAIAVQAAADPPLIGYHFSGEEVLYSADTASFPTTALSYEAWVAVADSGSPLRTLFSYAVPGSDNEFSVFYAGGDRLGVSVNSVTHSLPFAAGNEPHRIVIVWDSTLAANQLTFYADGQLLGQFSGPAGSALSTALSPNGFVALGQDQDAVNAGYDENQALRGSLYSTRLWNTALAASEVTDLFANRPVAPATVLDLDFSAVSSTRVESRSGTSITSLGRATVTFPSTLVPRTASLEDHPSLGLGLDRSLVDRDGSETLQTTISGIPPGATLGDGAHSFTATAGNTTADVSTWNLAQTSLLPELNRDTPVTLTVTVTARETATGATASTVSLVSLMITPVNDAPSGTSSVRSGVEDTAYVLAAADFGYSDPVEGDAMAGVLISTLPADGMLRLNGAALAAGSYVTAAQLAAGQLIWTPAPNANGPGLGSFSFQVRDAGGTANGGVDTDPTANTLSFTLAAVNDAPVNTLPASFETDEDSALLLSGMAIADSDDAGAAITVTLSVDSGRLEAVSQGGVSVSGTGTDTLTLVGSLGQINSLLAGAAAPRFVPAADASGSVTLTMTSDDGGQGGQGGALSDTATAVIIVHPVNDGPSQTLPPNLSAAEDTATLVAGITVVDIDSASVTTTVTVTNGTVAVPAAAAALLSGNDSATLILQGSVAQINAALAELTFTGRADYHGAASITVRSSDGLADDAVGTIAVTVTAVADVVEDTVSTTEDTPLTLNVLTGSGGVSAATFSDPLAAVIAVTQPAMGQGSIVFSADGTITYTPPLDYVGTARFSYTVLSGGLEETGTVNVTVTPVNDAPLQLLPAPLTTSEDTALLVHGVQVSDVDSATLTTTLQVSQGVVEVGTASGAAVSGNGSDLVVLSGSAGQINAALAGLVFLATADYHGPASIHVSTDDGVAAAVTGNIAITVTPVDDIEADTIAALEDTPISFNVLTGTNGATADSFTNPDARLTAVSQPPAGEGSVSFDADGTITYTPYLDFNGTTSFTYTITAGGVTESSVVTINVDSTYDPPDQTVPGPQTTTEDSPVVISGITVGNVDGVALVTTLQASHGVLTITAGSGATVTGEGSGTVTVAGSVSEINAALTAVRFVPAADFNGAASLTVSSSDGIGPALVSVVPISVIASSDIVADTLLAIEDTPISFNVMTGTNGASVDSFVDPLARLSAVTQPPPGEGSVSFDSDGTIHYQPAPNFNGWTSFSYTVNAGGSTETATVSIHVSPVNDAPVNTVPGPRYGLEDQAFAIGGITVHDVDGGPLTTTLSVQHGTLSLTAGGGGGAALVSGAGTDQLVLSGAAAEINATLAALSYASVADFHGNDTLVVSTSDGVAPAVVSSIALIIAGTADASDDSLVTAEDTAVVFNVLTGGGGATADGFSDPGARVTAVSQPAAGQGTVSFDPDGTLRFTPAANFNGTARFSYTVTAGGVMETAQVQVLVTAVDDPPALTVPLSQVVPEDVETAMPGIVVTELDGDQLTVALELDRGSGRVETVGTAGVTGNGSATLVISGTMADVNATLAGLRYLGPADFFGADRLGVRADDGQTTVEAEVDIRVEPIADIVEDRVTTREDEPIRFNILTGEGGAAADGFRGPAELTSVSQPGLSEGRLGFSADGWITFEPAADFSGRVEIRYTVSAGTQWETGRAWIEVLAVNDPPRIELPPGVIMREDGAVAIAGLRVSGGDSPLLALTLASSHGTLTIRDAQGLVVFGNGTAQLAMSGSAEALNAALASLWFSAAPDYNGAAGVTVSVDDGAAAVSAVLAVQVEPVNDAPSLLLPAADTVAEDQVLVLGGIRVGDADDELLVLRLQVEHGSLTLAATPGVNVRGSGGRELIISGRASDLNRALGALAYRPDPDFNGVDPLLATVRDGDGAQASDRLVIRVIGEADNRADSLPVAAGLQTRQWGESPRSAGLFKAGSPSPFDQEAADSLLVGLSLIDALEQLKPLGSLPWLDVRGPLLDAIRDIDRREHLEGRLLSRTGLIRGESLEDRLPAQRSALTGLRPGALDEGPVAASD